MQLSEKDTPKNQKLQTNSKNEIFFQDVRHGGRHVGQHGGHKLAVKVPDRVAHMKVNKVADMEVFKMADIVVSRPTR